MSVSKTKNRIVIDREKCTGCGYCVDTCHMGALALVDGKACLVDKDHCDGLGVCIGECPFGAISFGDTDRVSLKPSLHSHTDQFSALNILPQEPETPSHLQPKEASNKQAKEDSVCRGTFGCECSNVVGQASCPDERAAEPTQKKDLFNMKFPAKDHTESLEPVRSKSALDAWPIQLHLIRPTAPQFQNADLLIAASCSAFSHAGFHEDLLRGRAMVIACPKLDVLEGYLEKLTALFRDASLSSVSVVRMEVPCCQGLTKLVLRARKAAESNIPVKELVVGIQGGLGDEIVHL